MTNNTVTLDLDKYHQMIDNSSRLEKQNEKLKDAFAFRYPFYGSEDLEVWTKEEAYAAIEDEDINCRVEGVLNEIYEEFIPPSYCLCKTDTRGIGRYIDFLENSAIEKNEQYKAADKDSQWYINFWQICTAVSVVCGITYNYFF